MFYNDAHIKRAEQVLTRSLSGQRSTDQLFKAAVDLGADAYRDLGRQWLRLIRSVNSERQFDLAVIAEPLPADFLGRIGNGLNVSMDLCANAGHKEVMARRRKLTYDGGRARSERLEKVCARSIKADLSDYAGSNYELDAFNLRAFTIAHVENEAILANIKASMADVLKGSGSYAEFRDAARELLDTGILTEARLNTLYRTNLQTAYNAGKWAEQQQAIEELPYLEYAHVGEGVSPYFRPEHLAMDGRVWRKDDPIWDRIYPPNGFGCRCSTMEQDDYSLQQEGKKVGGKVDVNAVVAEGFDGNPGRILDQVIEIARSNGLMKKTAVDYGMGSMTAYPMGKPQPVNFKSGEAVITDYNGIPRRVNDQQIGGLNIDQVRSTIMQPGEVWGWPGKPTVSLSRFENQGRLETVVVEMDGDVHKIYGVENADELRTGLLMERRK